MYVGFVEALKNNFGEGGTITKYWCNGNETCHYLPDNYWYDLLYGSGVLLFCLVVCLVGAGWLLW